MEAPRKKPDNIVQFPNRQGGFEEIADDLIAELYAIVEANPDLKIAETEINARKSLFLHDAEPAEKLKIILEASERESDESFSRREKVAYYLAAALAYKELPESEKLEA